MMEYIECSYAVKVLNVIQRTGNLQAIIFQGINYCSVYIYMYSKDAILKFYNKLVEELYRICCRT